MPIVPIIEFVIAKVFEVNEYRVNKKRKNIFFILITIYRRSCYSPERQNRYFKHYGVIWFNIFVFIKSSVEFNTSRQTVIYVLINQIIKFCTFGSEIFLCLESQAVRLIQMTESTVLPVGITGTEHFKSVLRVVNPKGKIRVNIGTPFSLPPLDGTISNDVMTSMTTMIMERIAYLLPTEYRGYYSLSRAAPVREEPTE